MALTSPSNLFSPDAGDGYALVTDLAAMQDSVQAALVAALVIPIGGGISWWGTSDPASPGGGVEYAIPDGRALSRSTYAVLFALWSTTFGAGDGTTTFNMPNSKGRVQVGRDSADTDFDVMGETRGTKTHDHALSALGAALIYPLSDGVGMRYIAPAPGGAWSTTHRLSGTRYSQVTDINGSVELAGATDAGSSIQPSIVANTAIRIK